MSVPSSILIVGSGVFGLSTAHALAQRKEFHDSKITLLERVDFPAPDGSSIDSSRIVRADYSDGAYAALMAEGQQAWRGDLGADGRYTQSGLAIFADDNAIADSDVDFVDSALATVVGKLGLKAGKREEGGEVEVIENESDARKIMGSTGGLVGRRGYVNWTSGWAHAENAMKYVRQKVEATDRVRFRTGELTTLLFGDGNRVKGVKLSNGESLTAELTVLATGAWTPKFLDLRGIASATGQIMAYIDLTQPEQDRLAHNPVIISETNGLFIIPPRNRVLKVARHGYGYANPIEIAHPEKPTESGEKITVSLPRTKLNDPHMTTLPAEGDRACRGFLTKCIPDLADRPWADTRICWYTDTVDGNWLIDHHPKYDGLFVATGGSGHGYKFLPVIGERIVDVMSGRDRDELGRELRQKWAWPKERMATDHVWTGDWRGGKKGMILDEEYKKSG